MDDLNLPAPSAPPPTPPTPASPRRMAVVLSLIGLCIAALVGRVAYLQTAFASGMADRADRQHRSTQPIASRRGGIFDRNGLMLAGTIETRAVYADPKFMHAEFEKRAQKNGLSWWDFDLALERVAERIHADAGTVSLAIGRDPKKRYVQLARGLSDEEADDLARLAGDLELRGLGTEPEPRRLYPMGQLGAHVLGAVGRDDIGLEGIERRQNQALSGVGGHVMSRRDKRRRSIETPRDGYQPPRHGANVVLTIDAQLQMIAEEQLAATCRAYQAEGGCVVVMDPHTGEILALANYPTFFPQFLADSTDAARRNRAIVDPYEAGSVMKPFLMAGFLEEGATTVDEVFELHGAKRMPVGRLVRDDYPYPKLTSWDAIVKSSNIIMHTVADRMSYGQTADLYRRFGFASKTGIDLDGENAGLIYRNPPDKYTQGSISFGYAMMVTPIQLARAMAAIATDGTLVEPRLVAGYVSPEGEFQTDVRPAIHPEAVRPETAATMRRILADVFVRGTAREFRSDKYDLFGKTGTAHKSVGGQQSDEKYFASFVGGGPYEAPRLVIAVAVNEPKKELGYHGGRVAAAMAARILEQSLESLGVGYSPDLAEPPLYLRDTLHSYAARQYEKKRTLRDSPEQETIPAMEAEEEASD